MVKALELLSNPVELKAALKLKYIRQPLFGPRDAVSPELTRCYQLLKATSRSFAAVIQELHPELRDAVMLFYLVLRALDTVEDDMSIEPQLKISVLRSFAEKLNTTDWSFDGNSPEEKDRIVLVEFPCILHEYHQLRPQYRRVIQDITDKMGNGMAHYILDEQFNLQGVQTVKDYDLYCHYVAGLVGEGLTHLIVEAGFGEPDIDTNPQLYESMGLFLQKTNIIRDYAEDLADGRSFWPREVWSKYAEKLPDLGDVQNRQNGVNCINELVLNALSHVIDIFTYLSSINEQTTFQFCAIPQVMAIATLALVFNNEKVLTENVKIRKGTTCELILESRTLHGCISIFRRYVRDIKSRVPVHDPNYLKVNIQVARIEQHIEEMYQDKLPEGVKSRETIYYKKAQKRFKQDEKVLPLEQDEEYKFNMALTVLFTIVSAIYFYVK